MRFSVCHQTRYRYSRPVRLAGHVLRLTPRPEGTARLDHSLTIDPAPKVRRDVTDRYGNPLTELEFDGLTDQLRVESRFDLDTAPAPAPLSDGAALPPLPWPPGAAGALVDYLADGGLDDTVRTFATGLADASGGHALAFLERLNAELFSRTDRHIRPDGYAHTPAHTLATGRGACRDLTVLFMAACRGLGIPARFVSGYQARSESPDHRRHLHAWPEVYLPGIGWRGFDPTHGLPVTDGHVALCAAPDQAATMPLEGGFYGDGITSTLDYAIEIATDE